MAVERTTWLLSVLTLAVAAMAALSVIATTNPVPTGVTILQTDSVRSVSYPRVRCALSLCHPFVLLFPCLVLLTRCRT